MFNYAPHHEEREANNGAEFLGYHKVQGGNFNVFSDRSCGPGKQLVEDYGDNTNALYINHHGFVVEENPFDCVELDMPKDKSKREAAIQTSNAYAPECRPPFAFNLVKGICQKYYLITLKHLHFLMIG